VTNDVRWLDDDQQRAWRGLLDLHAGLRARLHRELQSTSGLSLADYDVLVHLTDLPDGRLRAFELGEGLRWEKSRVSKQVARMVERGLAPAHVELVRRLVFDNLSAAQVRTLSRIAATVLRELDEEGEGDDVVKIASA
jgi:hypothetical protein